MATSLEESEKEVKIDHLPLGEKLAKIGPVNPEIPLLREIIFKI